MGQIVLYKIEDVDLTILVEAYIKHQGEAPILDLDDTPVKCVLGVVQVKEDLGVVQVKEDLGVVQAKEDLGVAQAKEDLSLKILSKKDLGGQESAKNITTPIPISKQTNSSITNQNRLNKNESEILNIPLVDYVIKNPGISHMELIEKYNLEEIKKALKTGSLMKMKQNYFA